MNYISKTQIKEILLNSVIKMEEFMEGLKEYKVGGKTVYSYRDVQQRYNKMTTDYYSK